VGIKPNSTSTLVCQIYSKVNANTFINILLQLSRVEQGLTSHQTHYRSYRGQVFILSLKSSKIIVSHYTQRLYPRQNS